MYGKGRKHFKIIFGEALKFFIKCNDTGGGGGGVKYCKMRGLRIITGRTGRGERGELQKGDLKKKIRKQRKIEVQHN